MRLSDHTMMTQDEEYRPESRISDQIRAILDGLKLDTYNGLYIIRVTVDKVDLVEATDDSDD